MRERATGHQIGAAHGARGSCLGTDDRHTPEPDGFPQQDHHASRNQGDQRGAGKDHHRHKKGDGRVAPESEDPLADVPLVAHGSRRKSSRRRNAA